MHDFGKPWWGVAYVPCMTNLRALCAWVIRWHVTCMLSLAEHWQGRRALSNHVCAHSVISMWHVVCLQHLARACNLGQPLFCLSITWSRCRDAYRDLWIMTNAMHFAQNGKIFDRPPLMPAVHCWPWGVFSSWLASHDLSIAHSSYLARVGPMISISSNMEGLAYGIITPVNIVLAEYNIFFYMMLVLDNK